MEEGFRARYKKDNYWSEKPPKKNIHVIVEPLVSTTTSASNEILELKEQRASLQALLNMSETNEGFKWTVNIDDAVLEGLKEYIREMDKPPALENDGAVLNFISSGERYSPQNDQNLCKMLRLFVINNSFKFLRLLKALQRMDLTESHNGQGNLDYAIECRSINRIVGLVEVKKDDFKQGFAQMESSLNAK
ncbi:hypothetical protein RhiirB3_474484 [Rhizophagus irregularis]|nr:hypothetical protein RhiirB3_474484 [Rhizophagus irregularis]